MLLALCLNNNNNYSSDLNTEGDRETMPGLGEALRRLYSSVGKHVVLNAGFARGQGNPLGRSIIVTT